MWSKIALVRPTAVSLSAVWTASQMLGLLDGASRGPAWHSGVPSCTSSPGRRRVEPRPGSSVILSIKTGDWLFTKSAPLGIAAVQSWDVSDAFMNTFHVADAVYSIDGYYFLINKFLISFWPIDHGLCKRFKLAKCRFVIRNRCTFILSSLLGACFISRWLWVTW